jgi:hypothetical protein
VKPSRDSAPSRSASRSSATSASISRSRAMLPPFLCGPGARGAAVVRPGGPTLAAHGSRRVPDQDKYRNKIRIKIVTAWYNPVYYTVLILSMHYLDTGL